MVTLSNAQEIASHWISWPGIVTALVGAAAAAIFRFLIEIAQQPSRERREIEGRWIGTGVDIYVEDGSPPLRFDFQISFRAGWRDIAATAYVSLENGNNIADSLVLRGRFHGDSILLMNYRNKSNGIQLGVAVFRMSQQGSVLKAVYSGVSPRRSTFISGTISLTRENQ
jgi:hypothetical protein